MLLKKKEIIALALCVSLCAVLCVTGCGKGGTKLEETTADAGAKNYVIEVKTESNQALSEISLLVYEDHTLEDIVCVQKTDDSGRVSFETEETGEYVVVLRDVPEGFHTEAYYEMKGELTQIVLNTELLPLEDLSQETFELGDVMKDFSVTTPEGAVCMLSELLQDKEAVVLNFWYLTCEPCRMEFPYLQEAYEQYSDKIAVVAMNPVNTEDEAIGEFQKELGITFDMAQCSPDWERAMQLTGYPTTVVIDRYGYISLIHRGAVTDTETFTSIFEFYTSDGYQQTILKDIADIM